MSRLVAFTVGGVFMVMQVLAYNGYVKIDMDKIESDIEVLVTII